MEFKKCQHCGKDINIEAEFCGFCGKKFRVTTDNSNKTDLKANKINISQVRPWVRFFARMIDSTIFVFIVVIVLIFTAPSLTSSLGLNDYSFGFICCFLWIFVESFFLSQWGSTPGKWIYATSVKKRNGNNLKYSDALKRSFAVWIKGIGLGIPIVAFFTQINAYNTLEREKITSWDKEGNSVVFHSKIGWWRIILIIFCFLILVILNIYSS